MSREAYFLDLATELAATSPLPLMLTGGISRRDTAEKVLAGGVAVVGMATAMAVTPDLPNRWRAGEDVARRLRPVTWSDKTLASAAGMALVRHQLRRIARGTDPVLGTRPWLRLGPRQPRPEPRAAPLPLLAAGAAKGLPMTGLYHRILRAHRWIYQNTDGFLGHRLLPRQPDAAAPHYRPPHWPAAHHRAHVRPRRRRLPDRRLQRRRTQTPDLAGEPEGQPRL